MKKLDKIIFIDDDKLTLEYHKGLASKSLAPQQVLTFENPSKALNEIKSWHQSENECAFIFVDVDMPEMSGHEFISQIKSTKYFIDNHCNLIYLSSHDTITNLVEALDRKIEFFIKKPLTTEQLNDVIIASAL